ncbi:hypothetical protein H2202_006322 [Exophiala xenobiotica]|nr:hypothetical protein H2202_006322 [Exophiala xenobiotica]KAK5230655.1 hypothetical protein LTR47_007509 [Exophiala xenobiotica]KAK5248109.1 hypothetical protein LTS06_006859 [Exophiala xenobiotica]KAK5347011.1 hypothetical protein LTR61_009176 [Exophiala xenobiotica]KAK5363275.1 hypothetical protein LTR11_009354 [Exophiala xenobiotica]
MNQLRLAQCLGTVSSPSYRRHHNENLINTLAHDKKTTFSYLKPDTSSHDSNTSSSPPIAHQAGVNCLTIDHNEGRHLISGGADSSIRLWDLEQPLLTPSPIYNPVTTLARGAPSSHTHALTSLSIYPFDPTPSTLISTSYDKTLKLTSITPSSLSVVHTFDLDFIPYTHALSPLPDSSPLIAVGTAHPAIRLLDLRSGLSTHSLSGPNGAIYTLSWSPRSSHVLCSGSTDGKVLFFDIRRANAAFASLDLDDAIGVVGETPSSGLGARPDHLHLDFNAVAHNGAVTSVQWTPSGDKIVTAGHDQRIRVWDAATGRNDLVHFGPRIRNERQGELKPLLSPAGMHGTGRESLFWPNDDGRCMIFQHHLREGHLLRILKTEGIRIAEVQAAKGSRSRGGGGGSGAGGRSGSGGGGGSNVARLTSGGRISALVWRVDAPVGEGVEMYTAHGDGRICAWTPKPRTSKADEEDDEEVEDDAKKPLASASASSFQTPLNTQDGENVDATTPAMDEAERRRKRKRDLIGDLVEGLTRRPMPFS